MPLYAINPAVPAPAGNNPVSVQWWLLFGLLVAVLIAFDLFVIHRKGHEPSMRESAITVAVWFLLAVAFNAFVWWKMGSTRGVEFATGYLVEWSMSMDNVFVFVVIFRYFKVPKEYQYGVLFWGILGAVLMRLGFILAGAALIAQFHWLLPIFGLFLIYTAYKLVSHSGQQIDPSHTLAYRLAGRWLAKGEEQRASEHFFVRENGRLRITPLFLVLLIVETTDVVFAVDSIPAIFGITLNSFIIFTSNVFAILGLRALYFLLAGLMDSFRFLHYGLAAVLAFVGLKMVAEGWLPQGAHIDLPPWASLVVIVTILGASIVASLLVRPNSTTKNTMDTKQE
jgi:tellurite resistance protein TerC